MNTKLGLLVSVLALFSSQVFATAYQLPTSTALIGQIEYTSGGDLRSVAKRYDLGLNALESANPQGFGGSLVLPTQHLLPNLPRRGIVINLPEMRMYYYPNGTGQVLTYPIGIGKIGRTIPITQTYVTRKTINPTWRPPESIREFNLEQGIVLPDVMPPGPDNPLGPYAIYMGIPTYLIHSTIFPESIGKRASFGCIRMYESDIEEFFPSITSGIPVAIINSPVKAGWQGNRLYVEAHQPLEEHQGETNATLSGMAQTIRRVTGNRPVLIDWQALSYIARERDGIPHEIGIKIR